MISKDLFFRDFINKLIEQGGDISYVYFKSPDLMNEYRIKSITGNHLICDRIRIPSVRVDKRIASFSWGRSSDNSNIYNFFCVKKISSKKIGKGLKVRTQVIVELYKKYGA